MGEHLCSDRWHYSVMPTTEPSICFLPCSISFIHTPPLFLSANRPPLSHFSNLLIWLAIILSLTFLFTISIFQSLRANWEIICNITLQCTSLLKRGACVGTMWVGSVCIGSSSLLSSCLVSCFPYTFFLSFCLFLSSVPDAMSSTAVLYHRPLACLKLYLKLLVYSLVKYWSCDCVLPAEC